MGGGRVHTAVAGEAIHKLRGGQANGCRAVVMLVEVSRPSRARRVRVVVNGAVVVAMAAVVWVGGCGHRGWQHR